MSIQDWLWGGGGGGRLCAAAQMVHRMQLRSMQVHAACMRFACNALPLHQHANVACIATCSTVCPTQAHVPWAHFAFVPATAVWRQPPRRQGPAAEGVGDSGLVCKPRRGDAARSDYPDQLAMSTYYDLL